MDLCRGTQEVEAVLSESNEETGAYDGPVSRHTGGRGSVE